MSILHRIVEWATGIEPDYEDDVLPPRRQAALPDERLAPPPKPILFLYQPQSFAAVSDITKHIKQAHSVILNMDCLPQQDTRRMVDILSGVTYAHDGLVRRLVGSTYIFSAPALQVEGYLSDSAALPESVEEGAL